MKSANNENIKLEAYLKISQFENYTKNGVLSWQQMKLIKQMNYNFMRNHFHT